MRTLSFVAIATSAMLSLMIGCGKKDSQATGQADMNAACYAVQTQQGSTYTGTACNHNYSAAPGFTNYNPNSTYGSSSWSGGGCSSYYSMAYSDKKGLACVETRSLQYSGTPARYQLTINGVFSLLPMGSSNFNNSYGSNYYTNWNNSYGASSYGSSAVVYRVCADDDPCPSNLRCLSPLGFPRSSGSELGICFH